MRSWPATVAVGTVLVTINAWTQVPPVSGDAGQPSRAPGAIGHPTPSVEGPAPTDPVTVAVGAARAQIADGHGAEALAALRRLPLRLRGLPAVGATRAIATFAVLAPPLEPGSARTLPPAGQTSLGAVITSLTPWVAAHPDDALAALTLGRAWMVHGDLTAAAEALDVATRARSTDPVPWNDRAMVLVALHRLPDAERCLDEATRLAPRDAEPWDNLGAVRLARGESRRAAEAFRQASEAQPDEARYLSDLGSALLAAGDADGAVQTYRRAAQQNPSSAVVAANLGYGLALANRLDEALTELHRAVTLDPASVTAWDNLGLVLARRGDREAASEAFHRAQTLDPADPRARANLDALHEGAH